MVLGSVESYINDKWNVAKCAVLSEHRRRVNWRAEKMYTKDVWTIDGCRREQNELSWKNEHWFKNLWTLRVVAQSAQYLSTVCIRNWLCVWIIVIGAALCHPATRPLFSPDPAQSSSSKYESCSWCKHDMGRIKLSNAQAKKCSNLFASCGIAIRTRFIPFQCK